MLTLPFPRTRGALSSFGLVMSILIGGVLMALIGTMVSWEVGLSFGVGCLLAGLSVLLRPQLAYYPYRAWNLIGRKFSQFAEQVLLRICFYGVLGAVSLAGGGLALSRLQVGQSVWVPRRTQCPETYHFQDFFLSTGHVDSGWVKALWRWIIASRQYWVIAMVPFFILLSAVQTKQEGTLPSDIYTLF